MADIHPMEARGPARINPADKAQLAESPVSLRRVAGLFRGHAPELTAVTAIIVVASVVGLAQPFLLREIIDVALPTGDTRLLAWLVGGMVAVAAVTGVLGVWQTWLATSMGQRVMHVLRTSVFAHLQAQSIAFFKRTRGGDIQSRLMQDVAGLQSVITTHGHLDRLQPDHCRRDSRGHGRAELAPLPAVAARAAAGHPAHPPRRAGAARPHHDQAEGPLRPAHPGGGDPQHQRRPAHQDPRQRPGRPGAVHRDVLAADRPRGALAAGRTLADGHDGHRLRSDPRPAVPGRRLPGDLRRHLHRHPDRLRQPPGLDLPADHGPAEHRRPVGRIDGPAQPDLRLPRPAGRGGRAHPPGAGQGVGRAWPGALRARELPLPRRRRGHPQRHRPDHRRRPVRRCRRGDRFRQVDAGSPAGAAGRSHRRTGADRRRRRARPRRVRPQPDRRHGHPGDLPRPRDDRRQPAAGRARRRRTRSSGRRSPRPRSTT